MSYTATPHERVWVESLPNGHGLTGRFVTFVNRSKFPARIIFPRLFAPVMPPVKLPVDWTKNNAIPFPYDGNDQYGDCMYAAACHGDNTFTGNVGTESTFDTSSILRAYLALSGGDNGLNEDQIVPEWKKGLAYVKEANIFDSVGIDPNNATLMRAAIYLFGGVQFQLSVPQRWISTFSTGAVWDAPATPNPANGHGIMFNGVDVNGRYKFQTWGSYGWITPAGVSNCDPSAYVVASLRWFNAQGIAPNGLHYTQLAPLWVQLGGKPWPASPFPEPTPVPVPVPVPAPVPVPSALTGTYQIGVYKVDWIATLNDPFPPASTER